MSSLSFWAVPTIAGKFLILSALLTLAPPNLNTFMAGKDSTAGIEADILRLVNDHRREKGLAPLEENDYESSVAATHSRNMASGKTRFGHDGMNGRARAIARKLGFISAMGENVAEGAMTAQEVVTGWLNSPGHRRNIEGDFSRTGIGVAADRKGNLYFTQIFTKP